MIIGVPKEIKEEEYRVGIVPAGVRMMTEKGHRVLIQTDAGEGCRIPDSEYRDAGAEIVESAKDLYLKSDMVMKVKEPLEEEYPYLREGLILYAYLHLAPAPELTAALLERGVIGVAYETMQLSDGSLPLLTPMSEVAGRMAVQIGAHYLEKTQGGRGVLLGGVPGVSRGRITILGAGVVGRAAAKIAVGMGAEVHILDVDQRRLIYMDDVFGSRVTTLFSHADNIRYSVMHSHLVIGAVLIPGARAPRLVTRSMVSEMKQGSVVVDVSIDQGGTFETSKPTSHRNPTYVVDDVIHYCVPNMPGIVARTSTFALGNTTLPYALTLADQGFSEAVASDPTLAGGVNVYKGKVTHEGVAASLDLEYTPLGELLRG
ncbi:MAG: alanine dehydrogenase [Deltaproteobacteria bacterium]|nr:alanine dehydrogenase [Deltaproteobacteria bacterium]